MSKNIIFYAYGGGKYSDGHGKSIAGHAFVDIEGYGTVGFYPEHGLPADTGVIRDETAETISHATVKKCFKITDEKWEDVKGVANRWRRNNYEYEITYRDCVNFVYEVADACKLKHDYFWTSGTLLPETAVKSIHALNQGA